MMLQDIIDAYPQHFDRFRTLFSQESERMKKMLREEFPNATFQENEPGHVLTIVMPDERRLPLSVEAISEHHLRSNDLEVERAIAVLKGRLGELP